MTRWPREARFGAIVTVHFDAETLWTSRDEGNRHRPAVLAQGSFGARVGVDQLLGVLDRQGLRTTFFVPGATAERHPDVVRRIVDAGHHLGHHGYEHERLEPGDPAREEEILRRGIEALTDAAGTRPLGYCAPGWQITPDTLPLLARHGFRYSTNLMDDIRPYVHDVDGRRVVELPVHWLMDDAPFRLYGPTTANRLVPMATVAALWREELAALEQAGGLFNLTLHPQISGRPSAAREVEALIADVRRRADVWMGSCEELAEHVLASADG